MSVTNAQREELLVQRIAELARGVVELGGEAATRDHREMVGTLDSLSVVVVLAQRLAIEAEVRERVARQIEADPCAEHGEVGCQAEPCRREGLMASYYARIARGSDG